jgi:hypothetical protein
MALHSIEQSTGTGLIGSILGYAIGNGIAAKTGKTVHPIIGSKGPTE